jgi:hypothetical protein
MFTQQVTCASPLHVAWNRAEPSLRDLQWRLAGIVE